MGPDRTRNKCLALFLMLMLLSSSLLTAWGETSPVLSQADDISPMAKISPDIQALLDQPEAVEAIVYLNQTFDMAAFEARSAKRLAASADVGDYQLAKRRELVVELQDFSHASQANLLSLLSRHDGVAEYESFYIANVVYIKALPEVIAAIARLPEVQKIEANETIYNEVPLASQSVTPSQEDELLWHLQMVKADRVWELGIDGSGVVVGVIDSGVDGRHPSLLQNWRGYSADGNHQAAASWFDAVGTTDFPVDSGSHGTHVAGTVVGNNRETGYITGVAPEAKWIAARVFDSFGGTTDQRLLRAAQWMLAPGGNPDNAPDVINNSWGGNNQANDWYLESVRNWVAAGILPVFAAGNQLPGEPLPGPGSISNPSHYEESYAVGAIDRNMLRGSFSKRGPSPYTNNWKPDISAPGVEVISSVPGDGYAANTGTSMAAPHVTGVAALMRSANAEISPAEMIRIFSETAFPLTDDDPHAQESPNHDYGYGLIDAFESVVRISGGTGTFTGKVLKSGSDAAKPVIEHQPKVTEMIQGFDIPLEATISDDISVVEAKIMVQPGNHEINLKQVSGDHTGGLYRGVISPNHISGETIEYYIQAKDFAGNIVKTPTYSVAILFGVVPGRYAEDFEGDALGWSMEPLWGIAQPTQEGEPAPIDGNQVVGTNVGGLYPANQNALLVSPPIDMRNTSQASLRFFHWHEFGISTNLTDYGVLYLSNDEGATLNPVTTYRNNSNGWQGVYVDLSDYAHSPTPVYAVFRFVSDFMLHYHGWYIDSVSLVGQDNEPPRPPRNLSAQAGLSGIVLNWEFSLDADTAGYKIFRSESPDSEGEEIGSVEGYSFIDRNQNLAEDTEYYYVVKAYDQAGLVGQASNQASAKKRVATTLIKYDFEDNDGGFVATPSGNKANDWEWGDAVESHGPGAAFSGTKFWATGLDRNYSNSAAAYLQVPDITVEATGLSYLKFTHWYEFEQGASGRKWDYGKVQLSTDGTNWKDVTPGSDKTIGGASGGWVDDAIELSEYAGQTVQVRFYYYTDIGTNRAGWFIDDVELLYFGPDQDSLYHRLEEEVPAGWPAIADDALEAEKQAEAEAADFVPSLEPVDIAALRASDEMAELIPQADITPQDIPLIDARVSVVESGITVKTDPRTGQYRILHRESPENQTWTLKASAYGYKPGYFESALQDSHTVEHNFLLQPEDTATIRGRVYDRYYNNPAVGAIVRIIEDPNIEPVVTDENGYYYFPSVYVGDYTLHASALDFESGTAQVSLKAGDEAQVDIGLRRFVGLPGEIIYDDGTQDGALVIKGAGNGLVNRFSPQGFGKLLSASFYFYPDTWPVPGGNEIGFGVFVKEGDNVRQIGQTIVRDDIVRGGWNTVDLSGLEFSTDQDFYVGTIQTKAGSDSPGLGLDHDGPTERAYLYVNGGFVNFDGDQQRGVNMIRVAMHYAVDTPQITNLDDINYVSSDTVAVEGTVNQAAYPVLVYLNEELIETIPADEISQGTFRTEIALPQEINQLRVSTLVDQVETEPSELITIIKDQQAPELTIASPDDQARLNVELIRLQGVVSDRYFDRLLLNGQPVEVAADGTFNEKVILNPGENSLQVAAYDKAGNLTEQTRTVFVDLGEDVGLSDMLPAKDISLKAGDTLEVAFSAAPGGQASYMISQTFNTSSVSGIAMTEGPAGRYRATWTAPENVQLKQAQVFFRFSDAHGNTAQAVAPGKISLMLEPAEPQEPISQRIAGANRYDTAVAMSQKTFSRADQVIIASGENFPDALVGGPLAESLDAPVLLTSRDGLTPASLAEIERLGATRAIVLGGEQAVSETVIRQLRQAGVSVDRLAGASRFETAVAISRQARDQASRHVFLVGGYHFPDALSIAPVAARQNDAILLTGRDRLPEATRDALAQWQTERITLVGGSLIISEQVEQELLKLGYQVERMKGESLYQTNVKIARHYFSDVTAVVGASGRDYPDALVASVYAAKHNAPIMLLNNDGLDQATIDYLRATTPQEVLLLGGTKVISHEIEQAILDLIR